MDLPGQRLMKRRNQGNRVMRDMKCILALSCIEAAVVMVDFSRGFRVQGARCRGYLVTEQAYLEYSLETE